MEIRQRSIFSLKQRWTLLNSNSSLYPQTPKKDECHQLHREAQVVESPAFLTTKHGQKTLGQREEVGISRYRPPLVLAC
jgi:hypothetical protein